MIVLAALLFVPALVTAGVCYVFRTWLSGLLLVVGLIPAIWAFVLAIRLFSDTSPDISTSTIVAPFAIGAIELISLWIAWYAYDPKSAGELLAVAEGVSAAYEIKNSHPVLGAVTGAGAVSQWRQSSSLSSAKTPLHKTGVISQPAPRVSSGTSQLPSTPSHGDSHAEGSGDTSHRLSELQLLLDKGQISAEEYAAARVKILRAL